MWLLEEPPLEHIKEVYGVELTKEWLERAQLSANPGRVVDLVTLYRGGRVHPRAAARAARAELTGKSGSD